MSPSGHERVYSRAWQPCSEPYSSGCSHICACLARRSASLAHECTADPERVFMTCDSDRELGQRAQQPSRAPSQATPPTDLIAAVGSVRDVAEATSSRVYLEYTSSIPRVYTSSRLMPSCPPRGSSCVLPRSQCRSASWASPAIHASSHRPCCRTHRRCPQRRGARARCPRVGSGSGSLHRRDAASRTRGLEEAREEVAASDDGADGTALHAHELAHFRVC